MIARLISAVAHLFEDREAWVDRMVRSDLEAGRSDRR